MPCRNSPSQHLSPASGRGAFIIIQPAEMSAGRSSKVLKIVTCIFLPMFKDGVYQPVRHHYYRYPTPYPLLDRILANEGIVCGSVLFKSAIHEAKRGSIFLKVYHKTMCDFAYYFYLFFCKKPITECGHSLDDLGASCDFEYFRHPITFPIPVPPFLSSGIAQSQ